MTIDELIDSIPGETDTERAHFLGLSKTTLSAWRARRRRPHLMARCFMRAFALYPGKMLSILQEMKSF